MRRVTRSALLPYSAGAVFALVKDVVSYPEFLPWCTATQLNSSDASELVASLTMGFGAINSTFTTCNKFGEPDWMTMQLVDGPFSSLEGRWEFEALGDDACEVNLQVEFEFDSVAKDLLFGATFETICTELIDAFSQRAHDLYG